MITPETLLELIDRLGMPAVVLVALALAGRAAWRFIVERAWPEWMEVQRQRLSEQKKTQMTVMELHTMTALQSERIEELFWSCLGDDASKSEIPKPLP